MIGTLADFNTRVRGTAAIAASPIAKHCAERKKGFKFNELLKAQDPLKMLGQTTNISTPCNVVTGPPFDVAKGSPCNVVNRSGLCVQPLSDQ